MSFGQNSSLKFHIKYVHQGFKTPCLICNTNFRCIDKHTVRPRFEPAGSIVCQALFGAGSKRGRFVYEGGYY